VIVAVTKQKRLNFSSFTEADRTPKSPVQSTPPRLVSLAPMFTYLVLVSIGFIVKSPFDCASVWNVLLLPSQNNWII